MRQSLLSQLLRGAALIRRHESICNQSQRNRRRLALISVTILSPIVPRQGGIREPQVPEASKAIRLVLI